MSVIDRLGRNLQFSAYYQAVAVLSSLFLTPFILRHVDLGLYGLNTLIVSIVGYFNIFDFGFNSAISRFAALFYGEGKHKEIREILRFGVKFFLGLGTLVALCLLVLSLFYERLFHIDSDFISKGRVLFLIYSASSIFMWVVYPFQGIIKGFQRMDIISKTGLVVSILNIPLAIVILKYTGSYLFFIALLQLLVMLLSCVNIIFTLRLLPGFKFNFAPIEKTLRSKLVNFSGWYFLVSILGLVIFQIHYFIIGAILGLTSVAIYSIAFNIHNYIRGFNSLVGSPLYYIITAEFARHDKKSRDNLIINTTRIHSGILIPIVIIAMISSDNFILSWVGTRFESAILPCKILLGYWVFNIVTEILSHGVLGAKGKVVEIVKLQSFVAIANLCLSLLLIRPFGITGVALGMAIPWIIASVFYVQRYCKILDISVPDFIRRGILPNLPHFLLALLLSVWVQGAMKNRSFIQLSTVMLAIYGVSVIFGYSLLSSENKRIIKKIIALRI